MSAKLGLVYDIAGHRCTTVVFWWTWAYPMGFNRQNYLAGASLTHLRYRQKTDGRFYDGMSTKTTLGDALDCLEFLT